MSLDALAIFLGSVSAFLVGYGGFRLVQEIRRLSCRTIGDL